MPRPKKAVAPAAPAAAAPIVPAEVDAAARALMQVTNPAGEFTARAFTLGVKPIEAEAAHYRARAALRYATTVISPSAIHDELARESPRKVVVDGHLALMRAAGITVDTLPVSESARREMVAADLAAAGESNESIKARIAERMRAMREGAGKTEGK